jgi:hypothetical protein
MKPQNESVPFGPRHHALLVRDTNERAVVHGFISAIAREWPPLPPPPPCYFRKRFPGPPLLLAMCRVDGRPRCYLIADKGSAGPEMTRVRIGQANSQWFSGGFLGIGQLNLKPLDPGGGGSLMAFVLQDVFVIAGERVYARDFVARDLMISAVAFDHGMACEACASCGGSSTMVIAPADTGCVFSRDGRVTPQSVDVLLSAEYLLYPAGGAPRPAIFSVRG